MKKRIPWTAVAVLIFVLIFIWGRNAEAGEVGIGLSFGLPTTRTEHTVAQEIILKTSDYRWYVSYTRIGANNNTLMWDRYADRWAGGYQLVWRRGKDWEPYMMLGVAYFEEPIEPFISERLTYDMRFGVRYKDFIELDIDNHNSTASRSDRNTGLDLISLRMIFQF